MTEAAQLIEVLERNYRILLRQCDGLTHAESLLQPPFRGNCLNWVLGHLTQSRERLLKLFELPTRWTDDEVERYQRDSPPVLEDGPTVISLGRMLQDFEAAHQHLHTRLETTDTVELGQPGKEIIKGGQMTKGEWVAFLLWHETYHIGQLEYLRQLAGKNDKVI
ncbi:MAG: DinB family protein [Anaerolineae bacterium]|nr:DinB family protein [Anaerolineae bacterium]